MMIQKFLGIIFQILAFVLYNIFLGWSTPTSNLKLYQERKGKKTIVVFPHSSRWDPILHFLELWKFGHPVEAIIEQVWLDKPVVGRMLRFIPGLVGVQPRSKGGPGGEIENGRLAERLLKQFPNGFMIFWSPAGGIKGDNWKSGFYRLACQLDAEIMIGGLDYSTQESILLPVVFKPKIKFMEKDLNNMKYYISENIVPLYPEQSQPKTTKSYKSTSVWGWRRFLGI